MPYNWQQSDWPKFRYDLSGIEEVLLTLAEKTGHTNGLLKGLAADAQVETSIDMMVVEALTTSAIEGELLSRKDVMSSIRRNLGMETGPPAGDKRAQGAAALMIVVRNTVTAPLTEGRLFDWHRMIMRGHRHIAAGQWRTRFTPAGAQRDSLDGQDRGAQRRGAVDRFAGGISDTVGDASVNLPEAAAPAQLRRSQP